MKYTLAIESSTVTPSAALLADKELLAKASWDAARGASQRMMTVVRDMLAANNITLNDIDLFGIGLGPGNFTGLRTTLSAIQAMALPTHTDIIGISSAEAIAYRFLTSTTKDRRPVTKDRRPTNITVVGDARRRRLWVAPFTGTEDSLQRTADFELVPLDDFADIITAGDNIITPDRDTLGCELKAVVPKTATLTESSLIPTASAIARLARQRKERNLPGEPLQPIYMHPPVFVKPRFN
jgi:tRNA threonylcarbamoyl adenosine modification protein YeaZ